MKRIIILLTIILSGINSSSFGQVYFTKNGRTSFYSKASVENISADNNQVISVLNTQTGALQFSVLNNAFHFPKAMMEQHFNSDYLESDKYPKSTFKGTVTDISKVDISKDGTYNVSVTGSLEIHGVSKDVTTPGTITVKDGKISGASTFKILLKDYDIQIPSIVKNNIAENIEINVSCNYEKKSSN
ncbi:MAG: YceI family protein [Ginsengibacter sp.]